MNVSNQVLTFKPVDRRRRFSGGSTCELGHSTFFYSKRFQSQANTCWFAQIYFAVLHFFDLQWTCIAQKKMRWWRSNEQPFLEGCFVSTLINRMCEECAKRQACCAHVNPLQENLRKTCRLPQRDAKTRYKILLVGSTTSPLQVLFTWP